MVWNESFTKPRDLLVCSYSLEMTIRRAAAVTNIGVLDICPIIHYLLSRIHESTSEKAQKGRHYNITVKYAESLFNGKPLGNQGEMASMRTAGSP